MIIRLFKNILILIGKLLASVILLPLVAAAAALIAVGEVVQDFSVWWIQHFKEKK